MKPSPCLDMEKSPHSDGQRLKALLPSLSLIRTTAFSFLDVQLNADVHVGRTVVLRMYVCSCGAENPAVCRMKSACETTVGARCSQPGCPLMQPPLIYPPGGVNRQRNCVIENNSISFVIASSLDSRPL